MFILVLLILSSGWILVIDKWWLLCVIKEELRIEFDMRGNLGS